MTEAHLISLINRHLSVELDLKGVQELQAWAGNTLAVSKLNGLGG